MARLSFEMHSHPDADATQSFDAGIATCLARLQREVPFGRWTLTRMVGDDWVMLHGAGAQPRGNVVPWDQTICSRMTRDLKDTFVPVEYEDARVSAPVRKSFDVGAYIGVALYQPSGEPLGTLGSVDTRRHQPPRARRQIEALQQCGRLIVQLIEHGRVLMRCARAATHGLLRQQAAGGLRWLPPRGWRQALRDEDEARQPLAAPAAVLAVSIKESPPAQSLMHGAAASRALDQVDAVLAGLVPDYVGTHVRALILLALIPECDGQRARQIETRMRLLLDSRGLKTRCSAVSARFDESLRKAEAAALRTIA